MVRRFLNSGRIYHGPDHDLGGARRTKAKRGWGKVLPLPRPLFECATEGCATVVETPEAVCIFCALGWEPEGAA